MSDTLTRTTSFQEKYGNAAPASLNPDASDDNVEPEYMWRGQRFRLVTMRQAPLMQFRLWVSPAERLQIKYAYITHQIEHQQNDENKNEIEMIIRDAMRVKLAGFNLGELEDALMLHRVSEIKSVSTMQAEAALKHDAETSVITDISVEYGRFDVENRQWLPGNGYWCPRERRWVPKLPDLG